LKDSKAIEESSEWDNPLDTLLGLLAEAHPCRDSIEVAKTTNALARLEREFLFEIKCNGCGKKTTHRLIAKAIPGGEITDTTFDDRVLKLCREMLNAWRPEQPKILL